MNYFKSLAHFIFFKEYRILLSHYLGMYFKNQIFEEVLYKIHLLELSSGFIENEKTEK